MRTLSIAAGLRAKDPAPTTERDLKKDRGVTRDERVAVDESHPVRYFKSFWGAPGCACLAV